MLYFEIVHTKRRIGIYAKYASCPEFVTQGKMIK